MSYLCYDQKTMSSRGLLQADNEIVTVWFKIHLQHLKVNTNRLGMNLYVNYVALFIYDYTNSTRYYIIMLIFLAQFVEFHNW